MVGKNVKASHNTKEILQSLEGKIIVSCQGVKENIFYSPEHMLLFAKAAYVGGAISFRVNSPKHVSKLKENIEDSYVIGISKKLTKESDVFITPNMEEIDLLINAGADIIALDGTNRINNEGNYAWQTIVKAKEKYPNMTFMADVATFEDAKYAIKAGADIIASTLYGYTKETSKYTSEPTANLIKEIRKSYPEVFLIAEGRIWGIQDALRAFEAGANAIVVGSAITAPTLITKHFIEKLNEKIDLKNINIKI